MGIVGRGGWLGCVAGGMQVAAEWCRCVDIDVGRGWWAGMEEEGEGGQEHGKQETETCGVSEPTWVLYVT